MELKDFGISLIIVGILAKELIAVSKKQKLSLYHMLIRFTFDNVDHYQAIELDIII